MVELLLFLVPLMLLKPLVVIPGYFVPIRYDDVLVFIILYVVFSGLILSKRTKIKTPLDGEIWLFVFLYILSILLNYMKGTMLAGVLNLFRLLEFIAVYYTVYLFADARKVGRYFTLILASFVIVGIIGSLQYYFGIFTNVYYDCHRNVDEAIGTRFSTFEGSTDYGTYLLVATSILFAFLLNRKALSRPASKIAVGLLLCYGLYSIILADSRSALIIAFPILGGMCFKSKSKKIGTVILLLFFVSVPYLMQTAKIQTFVGILRNSGIAALLGTDPSFAIRLHNWPVVFSLWLHHPLLGNGPGFLLAYLKENFAFISVDNYYLRILGELGLFGLAGFMLIICKIITIERKILKTNPRIKENALVLGIMSGSIALLLMAMLSDVFEEFKTAMYFWILTAIAMKIYSQTMREKQTSTGTESVAQVAIS